MKDCSATPTYTGWTVSSWGSLCSDFWPLSSLLQFVRGLARLILHLPPPRKWEQREGGMRPGGDGMEGGWGAGGPGGVGPLPRGPDGGRLRRSRSRSDSRPRRGPGPPPGWEAEHRGDWRGPRRGDGYGEDRQMKMKRYFFWYSTATAAVLRGFGGKGCDVVMSLKWAESALRGWCSEDCLGCVQSSLVVTHSFFMSRCCCCCVFM